MKSLSRIALTITLLTGSLYQALAQNLENVVNKMNQASLIYANYEAHVVMNGENQKIKGEIVTNKQHFYVSVSNDRAFVSDAKILYNINHSAEEVEMSKYSVKSLPLNPLLIFDKSLLTKYTHVSQGKKGKLSIAKLTPKHNIDNIQSIMVFFDPTTNDIKEFEIKFNKGGKVSATLKDINLKSSKNYLLKIDKNAAPYKNYDFIDLVR